MVAGSGRDLSELLAEIDACDICAAELPLGPRPVLRASRTARLMVIGQAPGTRVHETGIPWNDKSGERLRHWLDIDNETFYDAARIAIVPMGFCYPGRDQRGGDFPPRPECAPMWHDRLLHELPYIELTLLVGGHAQKRYLGSRSRSNLTETVHAWQDYLPDFIPIPHPSWRTTAWARNNPWFATEVLPELRRRVAECL